MPQRFGLMVTIEGEPVGWVDPSSLNFASAEEARAWRERFRPDCPHYEPRALPGRKES